jgi:hypothetical protein
MVAPSSRGLNQDIMTAPGGLVKARQDAVPEL